ncbi:ubiquinol oxidase subunit II [Mesorhizobium loti]|uniref:ubiquinol oxidase subunit II n=1 Tax=Rhizobium loti TaxID=381 RepID=UPI0003F4FE20|nr:ubiquinol oxidase subunit II [Mesorhizobium loti]
MHDTWSWLSGILAPQGPIAASELKILLNATAIMLAVIVPVIVLTLGFAWWFRVGNKNAQRLPDWSYSGRIELVIWSIPTLIVVFLGGIAWLGSHDLDPYREIQSKTPPLTVQVVSLDWKWLFIYPDKNLASVNQLVLPANTPINFQLTSASVMNSFFVPQLGSQIYTMAGMTTRLSLLADRTGIFPGISAQFSGAGFSDMRFDVVVKSSDDFEAWVNTTRQGKGVLDPAAFAKLAQQSSNVTPTTFAGVEPRLFDPIVAGTAHAADAQTMQSNQMPSTGE